MSEKVAIQPGTVPAADSFSITVTDQGPYLVTGKPPVKQQFILPDQAGSSWLFRSGERFNMEEPTALCRCGASRNKPYCDGSHVSASWDPRLSDPGKPLLEGAEAYEGPTLILTDNVRYCAFARFCDAKGRVWNLVGASDDQQARELTIREANHCPAGRLSAWDKQTQRPYEPHFDPSIGVVEDPAISCSGPLWVRGGIRIRKEDGTYYEIRNRVTLCRCGASSNKPFCDGSHASIRFDDGLNRHPDPDGETY